MHATDLEHDDRVTIDCEPLRGVHFRVSDTQTEDIGLTKAIAVTLVTESNGTWAITGTTAGDSGTISRIDSDEQHDIEWHDINKL